MREVTHTAFSTRASSGLCVSEAERGRATGPREPRTSIGGGGWGAELGSRGRVRVQRESNGAASARGRTNVAGATITIACAGENTIPFLPGQTRADPRALIVALLFRSTLEAQLVRSAGGPAVRSVCPRIRGRIAPIDRRLHQQRFRKKPDTDRFRWTRTGVASLKEAVAAWL